MIPGCNLHTHTTYCDGKNSVRQMVQAGIALGMTGLGFSGHSYTSFDGSYCMSREDTAAYVDDVRRAQLDYVEQLPVYLGIEQDIFAEPPEYAYDYILGAVHYVESQGCRWSVDESEANLRRVVDWFYAGDYYAYAHDYFQLVSQVKQVTGCQIVAHLDLMAKFNEGGRLFDESHPRYLEAAFSAIRILCEEEALFEVNTGAMSRGYRTSPYPGPLLLREIKRLGGRILFGSDSHAANTLLFAFPQAVEYAQYCGFTTAVVLEPRGFREIRL